MLNILLILILTLGSAVIICQAEDGGTIKCDASAREIGETGEIQCMYPTDLNSQTGIAVVSILHFEPNSTLDVPIVDCLWEEIHHCNNVRQGFKVTDVTGKSLKVTIGKVTKGHFGKYICTIFHASLDFSAETCIFQIKGATSLGLQSNSPVVDEDPEPGEVIDAVLPPNVIHSSGKEEEGDLYGTGNDAVLPPNVIHSSWKEKEGDLYGTGNDAVPPPNGIHSSGKEEEGDLYGTGNGATSPGLQSNSPVVDEDPESGEVIDSEEGLSGGAVAGIAIVALILLVLTAVVGVLCYFSRWVAILACCRDRVPGYLNRRGTHATNSASIEEINEDRAEDPMLPVNSAGGQNRPPKIPPKVPPRPSRENLTKAGTRKGSNAGGAEKTTWDFRRLSGQAKGGGGRGATKDSKEKEED